MGGHNTLKLFTFKMLDDYVLLAMWVEKTQINGPFLWKPTFSLRVIGDHEFNHHAENKQDRDCKEDIYGSHVADFR
jgi:hypothetical protein